MAQVPDLETGSLATSERGCSPRAPNRALSRSAARLGAGLAQHVGRAAEGSGAHGTPGEDDNEAPA